MPDFDVCLLIQMANRWKAQYVSTWKHNQKHGMSPGEMHNSEWGKIHSFHNAEACLLYSQILLCFISKWWRSQNSWRLSCAQNKINQSKLLWSLSSCIFSIFKEVEFSASQGSLFQSLTIFAVLRFNWNFLYYFFFLHCLLACHWIALRRVCFHHLCSLPSGGGGGIHLEIPPPPSQVFLFSQLNNFCLLGLSSYDRTSSSLSILAAFLRTHSNK